MKLDKTAPTQYPVAAVIKKRWSPRSFAPQAVSEEQLLTILEAGVWAPSAGNSQPWRFAYALKGSSGFEKLYHCLDDQNQIWAKTAAALVASIGIRKIPSEGKSFSYYMHDTGIANGFILLQATSMNIYAHPMAGFYKERVVELMQLPREHDPLCMIALGYLGDPEQLEEPYRTRELLVRTRRTLADVITRID